MSPDAFQNQQKGYYLHRAVFLIDRLAEQTLRKEAGITLAQFLFLLSLDTPKVTPMSQQSIADHLGINKAAVSRHVQRLEHKGWITRTPTPTRRERIIRLSDEGARTLRHAQSCMQRVMTPHYQNLPNATVGHLKSLCISLEQTATK